VEWTFITLTNEDFYVISNS